MRQTLALAATTLMIAACQTPAIGEGPAFLAEPSAQCITQMEQFASAQTNRTVTLTKLAFAQSNTLLLEQPLLRGPDGKPFDGRSLGRPEVFNLVSTGTQCVMVHAKTGMRKALEGCGCKRLVK